MPSSSSGFHSTNSRLTCREERQEQRAVSVQHRVREVEEEERTAGAIAPTTTSSNPNTSNSGPNSNTSRSMMASNASRRGCELIPAAEAADVAGRRAVSVFETSLISLINVCSV